MKVLVTGVTGQVAPPVALALAGDHEVWGAARFRDAEARSRLEAGGVRCVPVDLADGDFSALPDDFDAVLHFAVVKSFRDSDFDAHLTANSEATGLLMAHCRSASAFLYCSSTAVYAPNGRHPFRETDPLGDHHRSLFPTYSLVKIATEAVVRTSARVLGLPATIARLNVPYADDGGWPAFHLEMLLAGNAIPVHPDSPSVYNPIHSADIVAMVPRLLDAATVPATVVNWAGEERVSVEEWCGYLAELVGVEAAFDANPAALQSVAVDVTRLHELGCRATVGWRDGLRRLAARRCPDRVGAPTGDAS